MKKFIKFLLGAGAIIAAIGGIMYFLKNVLMKDYLEDYDDDDFDNDLYEEEDDAADDRDYVTINVPEKNSETSAEKMDETNPSENETEEDDLSAFDSVTD